MEKINYQLLLDATLGNIKTSGKRPRLLLHSCCAPCSSYVLEYLSEYFDITCYFFNPNISCKSEYDKRAAELLSLLERMPLTGAVRAVIEEYDPTPFYELAKGRENLPEGGERCFDCYRLRLRAAAEYARKHEYDYFTTSLSISPHKNAERLNAIGAELSDEYGVPYLYSDFKKRNGYKRSCELSAEYGLYRQSFCGCIYSQLSSEKNKVKI